jgi:hypothetical protein
MKISNKMKDYIVLVAICVLVIWVLTGALWYVKSLFAEEISEVDSMNKYYAEQTIQNEMRFNAMKEYMDNISEEEFAETFFKGE